MLYYVQCLESLETLRQKLNLRRFLFDVSDYVFCHLNNFLRVVLENRLNDSYEEQNVVVVELESYLVVESDEPIAYLFDCLLVHLVLVRKLYYLEAVFEVPLRNGLVRFFGHVMHLLVNYF